MQRYALAFVLSLISQASVADDKLSFEPGTPIAIAYNLARRVTDPMISAQESKGDRQTYLTSSLLAFERHMTPDQWQDFDADDITGSQDFGGFSVKSVAQVMRGKDVEIIVSYGNDLKDSSGKPLPLYRVGYVMKKVGGNEWKVDDFVYQNIDNTSLGRSFREMNSLQRSQH